MKTTLAILQLSLICSVSSLAHDLVLLPSGTDDLVIRFGHPGEYEPADLHRIFELNAFVEGQNTPISLLDLTPVKAESDWLDRNIKQSIGGKVTMVTGRYDNGYWTSVSKDKFFNTSKDLLPNGLESGHYLKFAKGLFPAIGSGYRRETGQVLEIIPQTDPFAVRPGGTLPVQVLFRGKPLADVGVEIGDGKTKMKEEDIPRYKTSPGGNG
jgi:uncharacterized GH25 family protein